MADDSCELQIVRTLTAAVRAREREEARVHCGGRARARAREIASCRRSAKMTS
jgi:hypothetical protein